MCHVILGFRIPYLLESPFDTRVYQGFKDKGKKRVKHVFIINLHPSFSHDAIELHLHPVTRSQKARNKGEDELNWYYVILVFNNLITKQLIRKHCRISCVINSGKSTPCSSLTIFDTKKNNSVSRRRSILLKFSKSKFILVHAIQVININRILQQKFYKYMTSLPLNICPSLKTLSFPLHCPRLKVAPISFYFQTNMPWNYGNVSTYLTKNYINYLLGITNKRTRYYFIRIPDHKINSGSSNSI